MVIRGRSESKFVATYPVPHYALLDYPFMFPLGIPNLVRSHGRWLIDGLCLVLHDKLELLMLQLQPDGHVGGATRQPYPQEPHPSQVGTRYGTSSHTKRGCNPSVFSGRVHRGQKYIDGNDDTLPLKLADGTVNCDNRFMLETGRRATITTD
ncbi:uncharacterized protein LOC119368206 [Triticum dicoccoides]|nr:uncharacterized protein LOC119368206 [Triticum dicoccoides]XP_037489425.1 uncharacterized protein LOC119368206 [Triticum dicoccoides]XP_037489426.1 uncharacterized protein LOC119368206 [Triticum dicoccoides]XP_044325780.1 uncharacterized protein LOC123046472 isoform X1 [Triticum aestivum]XP_044325781.1 uncharacterized protein LOC123046472 isoform X1 [Triticum aestivum]XP_044325782.1 uncharacterized protein LOC123046472 isoform X1 [Triticum aestivum]